jgi:hypothetical protein
VGAALFHLFRTWPGLGDATFSGRFSLRFSADPTGALSALFIFRGVSIVDGHRFERLSRLFKPTEPGLFIAAARHCAELIGEGGLMCG